MRFSLKTVLCWSFFLLAFFLTAQFLSELEFAPLSVDAGGMSLSNEMWGYLRNAWRIVCDYFYWICAVYLVIAAVIIFLEEQNPDRAIIWLATLLLFPVVGLIAYVILGPNLRSVGHRFRVMKSARVKPLCADACPDNVGAAGLEHLLVTSCGAVPTLRNSVDVLLDGDATFGAIKKALFNAQKYIHMEYFSIASDGLGEEIGELLLAKAAAGVTVRVLYDSVGSWKMGRSFVEKLCAAGVEMQPFMPTAFARFRSSINHRDHRKIVVVDGSVGFVGGLNIGDMYMGLDPKLGHWRDTHARITGEAVAQLNRAFLAHWGDCTGKFMDFRRFDYAPPPDLNTAPVLIATSGPGREFRAIADGYFHMITSARHRIWITTPYLVPGESISNALTVAARSGVDVRIIVPSRSDHTMVFWASQFNIDMLLQSGVRIFSYLDGFVHAKTMVMDGELASIGTTNLDIRSLEVNYEIQSFIRSPRVAGQLERNFLDDLDRCREEKSEDRRNIPFYKKVQGAIGRLWSSLL